MAKIKIAGSDRLLWIIVFPILAVGLIFLGILYYNYEVVRLQDEKYGEISAIAGLKFDSLLEWRRHRLADVRRASLGPLTRKELSNLFNDPANKISIAVLKSQLKINRKSNVYADALFLDMSGAILLSDTTDPPPVDKAVKNAIEIAAKERKEVMSDFFRSPKDVIYTDAIAPVYDFSGRIMAFMILRSNAADYLFPLIQRWPTPSKTAETLLVRRDGDFVLFLNELRHMQNTALTLRMPVAEKNLPAAQAIFGKYGRFYGKDYRGIDVLAMILPVPETSWFMVAKVDSKEILSEVKYRAWVITLFVFLLIMILGGAINVYYKNRNAAQRMEAEDELRESEEKYRILFQTAAEGILVADIETKRFMYANPAICRMLGYLNDEIISMEVKDIHPEGYLPHVTSQFLALAKGEISLASDIPCLRKDGRIIYADIAASTAVIDGRMCNVGIFTDITARKRSGKMLHELHDLSMAIMSSGSLEEALKLCLDAAIRLSELDCGGAYIINRSTGDLELITYTGLSRDFINEVSHIPADSAAAHIVYGKSPVYVDYKTLGVQKTPVREKEGLHAIAIIPILHKDKVIACFNIASHTADTISAETQAILEMIHASIGNTIGRIISETALRESEERYKRITNTITDYIYTVRVNNGAAVETKHGPGCHAVTGYYENEFAGDPFLWIRMVAPEDRSLVEEQAKRILADEATSPIEHRIIHKNGMLRWVRNTSVSHYDEHGILISYDGLIQNITERKLAEEAVRESEERYRIAIESANDGVTIVQNDVHVYVNKEFLNIFGYETLDEIVGKPRNFIVHPEYREQVTGYARNREKDGFAPQRYEFKGIRKDGRVIDIEVSVNTILYKGEKAILAYMRDITERKQAVEILRQERERFSVLSENAPFGMAIIDRDGKFLYINPKFKELFGYELSDIPDGKTWFNKAYPDAGYRHSVISAWINDLDRVTPGEQRPRIFNVICKDGTERIINFIPVQLATEVQIMTCEDITGRRKAEEALLESRNLLDSTQQIAKVGGWEWDVSRRTMTWTDEAYRIHGFKPGEIAAGSPEHIKRSLACYDPEDRPVVESAFLRCAEKGEPYNLDFPITTADGRRIWIQTAAQAVMKDRHVVKVVGNIMDITERRQAERALVERDIRFKKLSIHVPGMIYQFMKKTDGSYCVPFATEAIRDIFGCTPEDVREDFSPITKVLLPEDFDKVVKSIEYSAEHLTLWECEYRVQIPGQPVKWLFGHSTPEKLADGSIIWHGFNSDITEHKRAEEKLQHSHNLMSYIIEHNRSAVAVHDRDLKYIYVSKRYLEEYNVRESDIIGKYHYEVFPDLPQKWRDVHQRALAGEICSADDDPYIREDGTVDWTRWECRPWYESDGSIGGIIVYTEVITERKRAEDALRESRARLDAILRGSPMPQFVINKDHKVIHWNDALEKYSGIKAGEIIGTNEHWRAFYPNKRPCMADLLVDGEIDKIPQWYKGKYSKSKLVEGGYEATGFFSGMGKSGSWLYFTAAPIRNTDGSVIEAVETLEDITERRQAQDAIIKEKEKFFTYLENAPFGMMLITEDGTISYVNQKFREILGYGPEDIPDGRTWFRKAYPEKEYRHDVISAWNIDLERRRIGEQIPRVFTAVCKDGSKKAINFITVLISSGEYLMACENITARLKAEEEKRELEGRLAQAEKMEALGTLAGGVAHDLNNVLGILIGYTELLFDEKDEASRKEFLKNILDGGRKAAAMVEDMLTMTRRGVASRDVLNLNNLIIEYERSLELESLFSAHSSIEVKTDLDHDLLNISGSRVHLEKMLFNLILNAFEAMPNGGFLTIKTANYYLENPIIGYDEVKQGEYVVLTISDTGIGISAADIKRIFEPFYTKKIMGRSGTGLGLAVVWGTVKDHNGYINVQSEEGKGSVFSLYFPVTREEITMERTEVSVADYIGKGESILIVDDVKGQRDLAAEMLRKLNYNVSTVSSGEEALAYLKKKDTELLILDMIMDPGMDGLDTYKKILEIRPRQKAIIVSGFSETDRVEEAQAAGAGAYVKKPYVIEKLGMAVKKELERRE